VFYLIRSRYGGLGTGVFYDLGAVICTQGTGKGVLAAAILHPFQQCKGIEILKSLHQISEEMKGKYEEVMPTAVESYPDLLKTTEVSFTLGSFFDVPFSDACCFFANSTCFSLEMMRQIADLPIPTGSIALTLTKNLPGPQWLVLESFRKNMSWGEATVYIHRRVNPEQMLQMKASFPTTTYWYLN
jgi:hypothetical protein